MYAKFMTVINPIITEKSKETCEAWEGCISNNDEIALVKRPKIVKV
jgi:peptide deformylase